MSVPVVWPKLWESSQSSRWQDANDTEQCPHWWRHAACAQPSSVSPSVQDHSRVFIWSHPRRTGRGEPEAQSTHNRRRECAREGASALQQVLLFWHLLNLSENLYFFLQTPNIHSIFIFYAAFIRADVKVSLTSGARPSFMFMYFVYVYVGYFVFMWNSVLLERETIFRSHSDNKVLSNQLKLQEQDFFS